MRPRDHGHIHPPGHFCGSNCPMNTDVLAAEAESAIETISDGDQPVAMARLRGVLRLALDALQARVSTLQQERDQLRTFLTDLRAQMEDARAAGQWPLADVVDRAMAAEAALAEAERFREKRCIAHAAVEVLNGDCPICDTAQAEAALATTRQALTQIADGSWSIPGPGHHTVSSFARRALAELEGQK